MNTDEQCFRFQPFSTGLPPVSRDRRGQQHRDRSEGRTRGQTEARLSPPAIAQRAGSAPAPVTAVHLQSD